MSELQKWMASISGAVVGQMAVLAFFYLLVANPGSPASAKSVSPEPRVVTVMLSQLLEPAREELPEPEEIKPEPADPPEEPAPEEEPLPVGKQFVDTETNTARADAPKNAQFESDRNTTASTEFLPNPDLPKEQGPTMRGEDKIEFLSLANQEYVDGEIKPDPTPPPAMNQAASPPTPPAEETPLVDEIKDTAPSEVQEQVESKAPPDKMSEGESEESKPGEADTPPEIITPKPTQPEATVIGEEAQMAASTKPLLDPSHAADAMKIADRIDETDKEAIAAKITEEKGEPGAPEEKKEIKAAPVMVGKSVDEIKKQQAAAEEANVKKQLDESMFNPAFLAQRRKNNQNGDITTIGEGSVDAESTETGKYKAAVQQAISRKWHQYRQDRAQDVTWGLLRLKFNVTPDGKIRDLEIEKKEATELVTEFSLRAIVDAQIPPMPPDVASQFGPRGLEMHYNIVIY